MNTTKLIFILATFFTFGTVYGQTANKFEETQISQKELPTVIIKYAKAHFPKSDIIKAKKKTNKTRKGSVLYTIYLSSNFSVSFNEDMGLDRIYNTNHQKNKIPESVIPKFIQDYVSKNYPDTFIISWTNGINNIVDLKSGKTLVFNRKGKLIPSKVLEEK